MKYGDFTDATLFPDAFAFGCLEKVLRDYFPARHAHAKRDLLSIRFIPIYSLVKACPKYAGLSLHQAAKIAVSVALLDRLSLVELLLAASDGERDLYLRVLIIQR